LKDANPGGFEMAISTYQPCGVIFLLRSSYTTQPGVAVLRAPWEHGRKKKAPTPKALHSVAVECGTPAGFRKNRDAAVPQGARSTSTLG